MNGDFYAILKMGVKAMVKIKKWDKEKKKRDWDNYHKNQAGLKYSVSQNFCYIIKELWKCSPIMFLCVVIEMFAYVGQSLLSTMTEKYVVELAIGSSEKIMLVIIGLAVIVGERVTKLISNLCLYYMGNVGNFKFRVHMRMQILHKNLHTDYENNERVENANAMHKALDSTGFISSSTITAIRDFIVAILEILTFGSVLSMLTPMMIVIVAVPAIIQFYIDRHKNLWIWNMIDNWQKYDRQLASIEWESANFHSAKDVRIFRMQKWFGAVFNRVYEKRAYWYRMQDAWEFRHEMVSKLVSATMWIMAYGYVIWGVVQGDISVGNFVLYFESIMFLSNAVYNLLNSHSGFKWLSENVCYGREYNEMQEHTNRGEGEPVPTSTVNIEFKNVSYTYSGSDKLTINNISFTLHKGEKLALVGLNGAGKTTLIKLISGLYDSTEGEILVDGKPINSYNREEYFSLFSAVFQDITQLPVTIAENVSGKTAEYTDYERVEHCLQMAGLSEKINALPKGIRTPLVKSVIEDGIELSGGEAQKLALAKALYKDAPILLLDEPTSALDPIAEQEMYKNYANFSHGKSSIFISHRLASTRFCDRILLIENGHIVEEGSHAELMKQCGKYAELFNLQSSYYQKREGENFDI